MLITADISRLIWSKKYKSQTENSPEETFLRVARAVANSPEEQKEFFELMSELKFIPGGRILAYAGRGNDKATLSNCYVMPDPEDSMESIMESLHNCALTMKAGGGIGLNFSNLRPEGAYIKGTDSKSSGPVSFMQMWNAMSRTISGVGHRKGAMMAVMNIDHPDIEKFIHAKRNNTASNPVLEMFNISVAITDDFIDAVINDKEWNLMFNGEICKTVKARVLWNMIVENNWAKAEPGVIFIDRVNKKNNLWYCEKITATNPCVTKDTRILTVNGFIKIEDLIGRNKPLQVKVDRRACHQDVIASYHSDNPSLKVTVPDTYGGEVKTSTCVFPTGKARVFRVITKHGYEIRATDYHKFLTPCGYKKLADLKQGDELLIYSGTGGFGDKGSYELGLITGWLITDGYVSEKRAFLDFYNSKKPLAEVFLQAVNKLLKEHNCRKTVQIRKQNRRDCYKIASQMLLNVLNKYGFAGKTAVPEYIFQGTQDCVKGFLQAVFTADGTVLKDSDKQSYSLRLTSVNLEVLKDIQLLLINLGIVSRIYKNRADERSKALPDGNGGYKKYGCKAIHELTVSKENLVKFAELVGLLGAKNDQLHEVVKSYRRGPYKENFTTTVVEIIPEGVEEVYDVTQPETHSVVFNGLVTGQCGEQPLPPGGACTLGAINLTQFVTEPFSESARFDLNSFTRAVSTAVRFLDNTVDKNFYPLDIQRSEATLKRRIGLGIMGLASTLAMMKIKYNSKEALDFIDKVMSAMRDTAYLTSVELAKQKGAFPLFDSDKYLHGNPESFAHNLPEHVKKEIEKHGIRNSHLLTVAPTGSIAQLVNNVSSGIEPVFSLSYTRRNYNEEFEVEDYAWRLYREINSNSIEDKPEFFVTAHEISPEWHIKVMAQVQKYIDASVSKTINLPKDTTVDQMKNIYLLAYNSGLKGCTTYRAGCLDVEILSTEPYSKKAVAETSKFYERPYKLESKTYKVKIPGTQHAYYLTFSYENVDGKNKPVELFINTKDTSMEEWTKLVGRMVSAVFRNVDDPTFLIEEFRQIFSPSGFFSPKRRKYIPSLQAEFGEVMKDFFVEIGIMEPEVPIETYESDFSKCPSCGKKAAIYEDGCIKCVACGYSKCG